MPKGNKSEVDDFFDGLPGEQPKDADIFEEGEKKPAEAPAEGEGGAAAVVPGKEGEPRKNRKHRRLEQQLQTERELRIAAEARAAGIAEAGGSRGSGASDAPPEKWLRIYGDTPESRTAWALQKEMFDDVAKQAKESALQEFKATQDAAAAETKKFESFIDGELEGIEDEYDVDVTSDAPAARKARREFLELVQELSPKDDSGAITAYADFDAVWKQYAARKAGAPADNSRQKELAGRSMERSGGGGGAAEKQFTPGFFGWKNDMPSQ